MSISKADLRKSIYQQVINSEKLYYSYVNKSQQTLSMMKNQRFLIFNQSKGHLYYINQPKTVPFVKEIPQPKNNLFADINSLTLFKSVGNQFNIQFTVNKLVASLINTTNNQTVTTTNTQQSTSTTNNQMTEWNFICDNPSLSTAWVKLLQQYKDNKKLQQAKRLEQAKKIEQTKKLYELKKAEEMKKQPSPPKTILTPTQQQQSAIINNSNELGYNSRDNIREVVTKNTLGYGSVQPLKGDTKPVVSNTNINTANVNTPNSSLSNLKTTEDKNKTPLNKETNFSRNNQELGNSNISNQSRPLNQPDINIRQPLITNSRQNNLNNSKILDQQSYLHDPRLGESKNVNNSQSIGAGSKKNQRQPLNDSYDMIGHTIEPKQNEGNNNQNSRLTFKDQIQSIIAKSKLSQGSNSNLNQNSSYINRPPLKQSITKPTYNKQNDWNWKFYNNPSEQIIYQFEQYSIQSFKSILQQDRKSYQNLRVYLQPQSLIIVTDFGSVEAKKIKSQFKNYHFIMESIKVQPYGDIIGVPLTCLIEYQGLVAMVKSLIPQQAPKIQASQQIMLQLKQLERYTRVKNSILKKSSLYDVSTVYGSTGKRLIFINQLIEYLPVHTDELFYGSLLRPEHLLDNVNQFMYGGIGYDAGRQDLRVFQQAIEMIKKNTKDLAKDISCGDVKFTNGEQLKDIMHERGINLKYLPLLYNETTNKQVKKFVHSFMVAKIAKQDILSNIVSTRQDRMNLNSVKQEAFIKQMIEKSIRLLVEGNSNVSNELWKEISTTFKKQYGIPISNSDIHGPFFINCLMGLLKGNYDINKCDMKKVMFKDEYIIETGFVVQIGMKVKSYYRWLSESVQNIMLVCKAQKRDEMEFIGVCEMLELKSNSIPQQLHMCKLTPLLEEYLSSFLPPQQFQQNEFQHLNLYESISSEPPTNHSLKVTVNYLKWCLEYGHLQEFKMVIDQVLQLIDLWLGSGNGQKGSPFQCQFYEVLSEYYYRQGNVDDSINFLKESLTTMIKNNGLGSKKIGMGYFMLGEREMKGGRWNDAMQSYLKAKKSMQSANATEQITYPKALSKLSQLYLNNSELQNSLKYAKESIQNFEKLESSAQKSQGASFQKEVYDQYCMKSIQIMTRVFEIQNKKNELYRMAQMTTTKYNRTKSKKVYQQLVKITLTSVINKASVQRGKLFLSLIEKALPSSLDEKLAAGTPQKIDSSLEQLMWMSRQINVMQKFMLKFETLERIVTDINGKMTLANDTKDFLNTLKLIINVVGEQFIYGLVEQREIQE